MLLDSHILIWLIKGQDLISPAAAMVLDRLDDRPMISMASVWEIEIKRAIGKLDLGTFQWKNDNIIEAVEILPITVADAVAAAGLPFVHKDPFDRMLVAQALNRGLSIMSRDTLLRKYGIPVIQA
jgi:PIN domain nuclease of toxin-antitoxin system